MQYLGTDVKQADVILLGYPLMMNMSAEVRRNDLLQYEKVKLFSYTGSSLCYHNTIIQLKYHVYRRYNDSLKFSEKEIYSQ